MINNNEDYACSGDDNQNMAGTEQVDKLRVESNKENGNEVEIYDEDNDGIVPGNINRSNENSNGTNNNSKHEACSGDDNHIMVGTEQLNTCRVDTSEGITNDEVNVM